MAKRSDELDLIDLLRTASGDKRVAAALLRDPEPFARAFNLSNGQVRSLEQISTDLELAEGDLMASVQYE